MRRWGWMILLAAMGIASPAQAERLKIYIYSGTGFFINSDGDIVTNAHVVKNCKRIMVSGAVGAREASISVEDKEHDLALLRVSGVPPEVPAFYDLARPLEAGDRVVIVGYPGDAYKTGNTVTREATIDTTKGPLGEDKWMQLTDVIAQGNSGGPLLDTSGNIVGVIVARAEIYRYRTDDPEGGVKSQQGIAISVPYVRAFLDKHNVNYRLNDAQSYLSSGRLTDYARKFIVNVRCEYKTERVN